MRVLSKSTLRTFWEAHTDAEQALKAWYKEISEHSWPNPNDLKSDYPSASLLGDGRTVFNIKGNTYRLIVRINYTKQLCFVRFIGTHAEYDKVDAKTI